MKYQVLVMGMIVFMLMFIPVSAFEVMEGDSMVISDPVNDDLLISGGAVTINAPVKSITFAGRTLIVNAPVEQNLIAVGGEIQVNAPVGTDVIAAGGQIDINGDVTGKVLAAGGEVSMNGKTSNFAVSAGKVLMGTSSHISRDALISSSDYTAGETVEGELKTDTGEGFGPSMNFEKIGGALSALMTVLSVLFAVGMLILGVILIRIIPGPFSTVVATLSHNILISFVYGVAAIIISGILIIILIVTIIGIPTAMVISLAILTGLIISILLSGAALGSWIADKTGKVISPTVSFVIGYIILEILFVVPVLGFFLKILAVCTGLGALLAATWKTVESHT